jgi:hypothetical protein
MGVGSIDKMNIVLLAMTKNPEMSDHSGGKKDDLNRAPFEMPIE